MNIRIRAMRLTIMFVTGFLFGFIVGALYEGRFTLQWRSTLTGAGS